jgi:hypothetical protein
MAILTTVLNDALTLSTDLVQASGAGGQGSDGKGDHGGGPIASGGDNDGGQAACHDYGNLSGDIEARPVPSFWNFIESELEHAHQHANNNHHQSDLMRHHA